MKNGKDFDFVKYNEYYADELIGDLEYGKFVVYPYSLGDGYISYPQMGFFVKISVWDMATVYSILEFPRNWMDRHKIEYDGRVMWNSDYDVNIINYVNWGDSMIHIFGVYDKKPTWKEMREAYEKSFWYELTEEQKRNRSINNILR